MDGVIATKSLRFGRVAQATRMPIKRYWKLFLSLSSLNTAPLSMPLTITQ